LLESA